MKTLERKGYKNGNSGEGEHYLQRQSKPGDQIGTVQG